jgi:hypothetical protein
MAKNGCVPSPDSFGIGSSISGLLRDCTFRWQLAFDAADIGLYCFFLLQRPENNEQAIRSDADEDAHQSFETGRDIGYRAWPLHQRDQKAEDKLGADVADAIAAILNVVADPNSDG